MTRVKSDGSTEVDDRFLELIGDANRSPPSTFDILDVGSDERAHTRTLAWLLTPDNSHGLGSTFLSDILEQAGIEDVGALENVGVQTFSQEPDRAELDILVRAGTTLVCVEVKTNGRLGTDQQERQKQYLERQEREEMDVEQTHHVYLGVDESHTRGFPNTLTWKDVVDVLERHFGKFERDPDLLRFREWIRSLEADVLDQFGFSADTELTLRYGDLVEDFDLNVDEEAVDRDRRRLFREYWRRVERSHESIADAEDGWDEETIPTVIRRDTSRLRISKAEWDDCDIRFEIHATSKRLHPGNYSNAWDRYRTEEPHVELTLTYSNGGDKSERDEFLRHLSNDQQRKLEDAGFVKIRDELPGDAGVDINKYHVYSKQIPLTFDDSTKILEELVQGTDALVELEEELDEYVGDHH